MIPARSVGNCLSTGLYNETFFKHTRLLVGILVQLIWVYATSLHNMQHLKELLMPPARILDWKCDVIAPLQVKHPIDELLLAVNVG